MVHTGSVAKVQGEGKQWLTKHGNLPEGFSICPVHTGMNPLFDHIWADYQ